MLNTLLNQSPKDDLSSSQLLMPHDQFTPIRRAPSPARRRQRPRRETNNLSTLDDACKKRRRPSNNPNATRLTRRRLRIRTPPREETRVARTTKRETRRRLRLQERSRRGRDRKKSSRPPSSPRKRNYPRRRGEASKTTSRPRSQGDPRSERTFLGNIRKDELGNGKLALRGRPALRPPAHGFSDSAHSAIPLFTSFAILQDSPLERQAVSG